MTHHSNDDDLELFPRERLSAKEKAEIVAEFEKFLVISIKAGGGAHCINVIETYLKRRAHGYTNRRQRHARNR